MLEDAIDFMLSIAKDDYTRFCAISDTTYRYDLTDLANYVDASYYIIRQPSINYELVNNVFSSLSCQ